MLILDLPWPPSTNTYIRHSGNRRYFSPAARRFLIEVLSRVEHLKKTSPRSIWQAPEGFLTVGIALYPPTRRKVDSDNFTKATLDALVKAGVMFDDYLVQKVVAERRNVVKGGLCRVYISPYTPPNTEEIT
jgi:crossover junction endodeoxyribonuclease RusA